MKELFAEAESYLHEKQKGLVSFEDSHVLIIICWVLWIGTRLGLQIFSALNHAIIDLNDLKLATEFGMIKELFQIILAGVTLKVVYNYSKLEEQLVEIVDHDNQLEEIKLGLPGFDSENSEVK